MIAGSERRAVSRKTIGENSMSRKFVICLLLTVFLLTINCCKSNGYFVVVGVVSSYAEESKEEVG